MGMVAMMIKMHTKRIFEIVVRRIRMGIKENC